MCVVSEELFGVKKKKKQNRTVDMKRYRNGEIWDFETAEESGGREVILGLDGGTTSTVCICMPVISMSDPLPDPLPVLARAAAGCSNHNSVGGSHQFVFFFKKILVAFEMWDFLDCVGKHFGPSSFVIVLLLLCALLIHVIYVIVLDFRC